MHNSLERAAPGHAGFRPVEFLGHRFLRHYILPRLFFLGFAPQRGDRWDRDCRAPGVNETDEYRRDTPSLFSPFPGVRERQMCVGIEVFIAELPCAISTFNISFYINLFFFIIRMINYWLLHSEGYWIEWRFQFISTKEIGIFDGCLRGIIQNVIH